MGRELKRVALDFDWPLKEVWKGYINPYRSTALRDCPDCEAGYSKEYKALSDKWYGYTPFKPEDNGSTPFTPEDKVIRDLAKRNCNNNTSWNLFAVDREAQRLCEHFNSEWCYHLNQKEVDILVEEKRLKDLTHTWDKTNGWVKKEGYHPTAKEVNEWAVSGMGHDGLNQYIVIETLLEEQGLPRTCSTCNGKGELYCSEEDEIKYTTWEEYGPPAGEGYQMWETTSEGSPISPVFKTAEELAQWLADSRASAFGSSTATYTQWLSMIQGSGYTVSAVVTNEGVKSGVEYLGE